jgi:hypothetical protein
VELDRVAEYDSTGGTQWTRITASAAFLLPLYLRFPRACTDGSVFRTAKLRIIQKQKMGILRRWRERCHKNRRDVSCADPWMRGCWIALGISGVPESKGVVFDGSVPFTWNGRQMCGFVQCFSSPTPVSDISAYVRDRTVSALGLGLTSTTLESGVQREPDSSPDVEEMA